MRKPLTALPGDYDLIGTLDLAEDKRLALLINLLAAAATVGFFLLFSYLTALLRMDTEFRGELSFELAGDGLLVFLLQILVLTVVSVLLHEGVHALGFRLFNGEWPSFGFKIVYAYAAAPNWYMPRNQHIVVALAPLVVISLLGLLLLVVVPKAYVPAVQLLLVLNAAGAVGDLAATVWMLTKPQVAYVNDYGDGLKLYLPGSASPADIAST